MVNESECHAAGRHVGARKPWPAADLPVPKAELPLARAMKLTLDTRSQIYCCIAYYQPAIAGAGGRVPPGAGYRGNIHRFASLCTRGFARALEVAEADDGGSFLSLVDWIGLDRIGFDEDERTREPYGIKYMAWSCDFL